MTEYPFDTVRAMENLLLTGQRARYPDLKIIFSHGGGAIPYLASRIAGVASLSYAGGVAFTETMAQLAGYYFDLASATSVIQLTALKSFVGAEHLVTGIDCRWPIRIPNFAMHTYADRSICSPHAGRAGISWNPGEWKFYQ